MLRRPYGFRPFEGAAAEAMRDWFAGAAEAARSNDALAASMLEELRRRRIIVPGPTTAERACADALVAAERRIAERIAGRLDPAARERLGRMLGEATADGTSRFVWLRRHEPGGNSADAGRLLDRLEWIEGLAIPESVIAGVPPHRVARLRRQGERYYADGLRELPEARRLAILAVCAVEWRAAIADAIVETHERVTGRLHRVAERLCAALAADHRGSVSETLHIFARVSGAMVHAHAAGEDTSAVIADTIGWAGLRRLAATAAALTGAIEADPLDHLASGHAGHALLRSSRPAHARRAAAAGRDGRRATDGGGRDLARHEPSGAHGPPREPAARLRPPQVARAPGGRPDAGRSPGLGDGGAVLLARRPARGRRLAGPRHRYREPERDLVPAAAVRDAPRLAVPLNAAEWVADRRLALGQALEVVGHAAQCGPLGGGVIEGGRLRVGRLEAQAPAGADELVLDLHRRMPVVRVTDLLLDVDEATGFMDAFADLRTGSVCRDRIGVLSVVLADGLNLGLKKMAASIATHTHWQLLRVARWHVEDDA